ncbi:hypothetical protein LAUMK13_04728 [Mycobacterium innocens]|uniref:Cupin type-2 domain-containing protein n=2 Tax=Mycobacterium innocens TaxID=2341083 RepID=A0A498QH56_9MYCO|nr:hypothetical protein LAUMK13_04728 [Mycobacterium innocens]
MSLYLLKWLRKAISFQGSAKDSTSTCADAVPMFVSNVRHAQPFVAADHSEVRLLVDRLNVGIASVSLAHATVAAGSETVWHCLENTDEIYFVLSGSGLVFVGSETRAVGSGDTVWIPAGVPQKIRNLGRDPLVFLCACGPAYAPECDKRQVRP